MGVLASITPFLHIATLRILPYLRAPGPSSAANAGANVDSGPLWSPFFNEEAEFRAADTALAPMSTAVVGTLLTVSR